MVFFHRHPYAIGSVRDQSIVNYFPSSDQTATSVFDPSPFAPASSAVSSSSAKSLNSFGNDISNGISAARETPGWLIASHHILSLVADIFGTTVNSRITGFQGTSIVFPLL